MSDLFKRQKQLIINDVAMPGLEIDFNITFNADDAQPVNDVTITNLTPDTIRNIANDQTVILNAGYNGNMGNVLAGKISDIQTGTGAVDRTLKLMVTPDASVILTQNVSKSYAPGTLASFAVKDILNGVDLEVGTIKLNSDIAYTDGKAFSGTVDSVLQEIVKETGSFMFVRCNIIYIVDAVYEIDTGILLTKETGLIGSPEIVDENGMARYKITSLLNPMLTLGSVFRLESKYLAGLFRVEHGTHSGSNFETVVTCAPTDDVSRYVPPVKKTTGSGGGGGLSSGTANTDLIWNFLINEGFSPAAAAGVMGNIYQESKYDPNSENEIGAYGLFQWLGDRRVGLEITAEQFGVAVNDLMFQMQYFIIEVTSGGESNSFSDYGGIEGFKQLTDPIAACDIFEACFERSGGSAMWDRENEAQKIYDWGITLGAGTSGGGSGGGTGGDGNFPAGTFQCQCGCGLDIVPELKNKMNQVLSIVGDLVVTSGARCPSQNAADGGVPDSLHISGEACDSYVPGAGVDYLYNAAQSVGLGTLRYYSSGFVHSQLYPADGIMN